MNFHLCLSLALAFCVPMQALGFALPPRKVNANFSWAKNLRLLTPLKAFSVEYISRTPLIHGGMRLAAGQSTLEVLSADASQQLFYPLGARNGNEMGVVRSQPVRSTTQAEDKYWPNPKQYAGRQIFRHPMGTFLGEGENLRMHFHPSGAQSAEVWSFDVPFKPSGTENPGGRFVFAWARNPARLFVLPPNLRSYYLLEWTEESSPIFMTKCSRSDDAVLVENLKNGLARLTFFKEGISPQGYTIFDFGGEGLRSEVSRVLLIGDFCDDFVVSGNFGIVRVRYPRGFLSAAR